MCKEKDKLITKILSQIEQKKSNLGSPTVHHFDDGSAIVNFFDTWDSYYGGALKKEIAKLGDYPKDKHPIMVFAKEGIKIPLTIFPAKKTYLVIRGQINYFFENDPTIEMTDFTSIVVPKGKKHGGDVVKDTFLLIFENELDN